MLRLLGYASVLVVSFLATLWAIEKYWGERSPLVGKVVTYQFLTEQQPEVCATTKSLIQFTGKVCEVNGDRLSVVWDVLANTTNHQASCGREQVVRWTRKEGDTQYNARFFGSCGIAPSYFARMPAAFDPGLLRMVAPN